MAVITPLEFEDFSNGWRLAWTDSFLSMNDQFTTLNSRFEFGDGQAVTIDLDGPSVFLNICRADLGFIGGFDDGDPVIQGEADAGRMPIHLIFDRPVSAAGAHVSVVAGRFNSRHQYTTQMGVLLEGETSWCSPIVKPLIRSRSFKTAPFLGVRVQPGQPGIKEVYFDAIGATNSVPTATLIAINELHVLD